MKKKSSISTKEESKRKFSSESSFFSSRVRKISLSGINTINTDAENVHPNEIKACSSRSQELKGPDYKAKRQRRSSYQKSDLNSRF